MADFAFLKSPKLISRKTLVTEKSRKFHTDFHTGFILFEIQWFKYQFEETSNVCSTDA